MRIFVTGASGFIGSAVVPELIGAGHEVVGLARSDASAAAIEAAGAKVQRGDLDDLDSLRAGAEASDGVIHLAFIHDFSNYDKSIGTDLRAIAAFGDVLEGSDRPLVIASGLMLQKSGDLGIERDSAAGPRAEAAQRTVDLAKRGVRASVLRLPPTVHGEGDHGFVAALIGIAREKGAAGYVDDGANRWAAVHRLDAARLFRKVVETAPAGSVFHAVHDEGIPTREIAGVIGRHLGVPASSIAPDDRNEHFGWLGDFFAADIAASSTATREAMDWEPTHQGLVADLEEGHYFEPALAETS